MLQVRNTVRKSVISLGCNDRNLIVKGLKAKQVGIVDWEKVPTPAGYCKSVDNACTLFTKFLIEIYMYCNYGLTTYNIHKIDGSRKES